METLLWYLEITLDYIKQMLPCMAIGAGGFLALLHHRRRGLYRRGLQSGVVREIGLFVFVLFCAGLAALTVFPSNFWTVSHWQEAFQGLRPFFPITPLSQSVQYIGWVPTLFRGDRLGAWGFYMVLANALIFVPIGFFVNLLWRKPRWWKGLAVGFCVSFTIEFLQLFVNRSTDVDDLILNTTGAFLGGMIALLLGKLAPKLTRKFQVEVRHGRETGDPKPAPGAGAGQL
ncbi:VanZ family protein [uncultured Flavonifractor sp.]|uniref:VanZ family protein n=1 Tax=Candidatus Flavonifractor intestinigallinarum TaxID=2838586 RepID=A0A9D2SCG7_9FIRM|nr:VanZ family protein [uncultured Flavonifractor sp.]HJB81215.1 VanZ family protein [Candidatus Flavonifractor intestinigallinarum]